MKLTKSLIALTSAVAISIISAFVGIAIKVAKHIHAAEHVEAVVAGAEGSAPRSNFFLDHDGLFEGFGSREQRGGRNGHGARESNQGLCEFHSCFVV